MFLVPVIELMKKICCAKCEVKCSAKTCPCPAEVALKMVRDEELDSN